MVGMNNLRASKNQMTVGEEKLTQREWNYLMRYSDSGKKL